MVKPHAEVQMAELAVFVHGTLAALHALGIVYNARRGNKLDVAAHSAACAYDIYAVVKHARHVAELKAQ